LSLRSGLNICIPPLIADHLALLSYVSRSPRNYTDSGGQWARSMSEDLKARRRVRGSNFLPAGTSRDSAALETLQREARLRLGAESRQHLQPVRRSTKPNGQWFSAWRSSTALHSIADRRIPCRSTVCSTSAFRRRRTQTPAHHQASSHRDIKPRGKYFCVAERES